MDIQIIQKLYTADFDPTAQPLMGTWSLSKMDGIDASVSAVSLSNKLSCDSSEICMKLCSAHYKRNTCMTSSTKPEQTNTHLSQRHQRINAQGLGNSRQSTKIGKVWTCGS